MGKTLPTLTTDGFITHPPHLLVKLYEYYISSDYLQSVTFFTEIRSLPYMLKEHGDDINKLEMALNKDFTSLLRRYWSIVEVDFTFIKQDDYYYRMSLDVDINVDGMSHNLKESLLLTHDTFINKNKQYEYLLTGEY